MASPVTAGCTDPLVARAAMSDLLTSLHGSRACKARHEFRLVGPGHLRRRSSRHNRPRDLLHHQCTVRTVAPVVLVPLEHLVERRRQRGDVWFAIHTPLRPDSPHRATCASSHARCLAHRSSASPTTCPTCPPPRRGCYATRTTSGTRSSPTTDAPPATSSPRSSRTTSSERSLCSRPPSPATRA
jgi:hypothetical protein